MSEITLSRFFLLPELRLLKIETIGRSGAIYYVEKESTFEVCPKCATACHAVYDRRTVTIVDAPIRGKFAKLRIKKRRFWCHKCCKPFTEPISGIGKGARFTQRFKRSLTWAAENFSDLVKVQRAYRCSSRMVYKAFYETLNLRSKARSKPYPTSIGIDEHSIRKPKYKGTEYATIIVDHNNKSVFELVDGRNKVDLLFGLSGAKEPENVKNVTMDLSPTYRSFVKDYFPNARIIADRFHVQRLFSKLVNRERLKITGDKRRLGIRTLLLRRGKTLDSAVRKLLNRWLSEHPRLKEIYDLKERVSGFYRIKGKKRAERILTKILDHMGKSSIVEVKELRKVVLKWRKEILAYFDGRLTNGRVEGFNRKAKLVQRKAFGYSSFENYRLRLLNECRGKTLRR